MERSRNKWMENCARINNGEAEAEPNCHRWQEQSEDIQHRVSKYSSKKHRCGRKTWDANNWSTACQVRQPEQTWRKEQRTGEHGSHRRQRMSRIQARAFRWTPNLFTRLQGPAGSGLNSLSNLLVAASVAFFSNIPCSFMAQALLACWPLSLENYYLPSLSNSYPYFRPQENVISPLDSRLGLLECFLHYSSWIMGVRDNVCLSNRTLSEDRDLSILPSLFLSQHLAHSSQARCSCGTAKGTEYKRMARSRRGNRKGQHLEPGEGDTYLFLLPFIWSSTERVWRDSFIRATWAVGSRSNQEAESLQEVKVQMPLLEERGKSGSVSVRNREKAKEEFLIEHSYIGKDESPRWHGFLRPTLSSTNTGNDRQLS